MIANKIAEFDLIENINIRLFSLEFYKKEEL